MFAERLQNLTDQLEGVLAVSLVAKDGIPVESVIKDPELDVEVLAAELLSQVRAVGQDHRELSVGKVRLFSLTTDRLILMVGALTDEYYLLLILQVNSNFGQARFELRRAVLQFEEDLL